MYRLSYDLTFDTISPLRIGTGDTRIDGLADEGERETATVVLDELGKPWIPGSSLKGVLRSLCQDPFLADLLFGNAKQQASAGEQTGLRGALTVAGMVCDTDTAGHSNIKATSRTKIHAGLRTAEANKLFTQEWVSPGVHFRARIWIETRSRRDAAVLSEAFEKLLGHFAGDDGTSVGAGRTNDKGRLRLVSGTKSSAELLPKKGWSIGPSLDLNVEAQQPDWDWSTSLNCRGPYLAIGGIETVTPPRKHGGGEERPYEVTVPLMEGALPALSPTGVRGALRDRARWILRVGDDEATLKAREEDEPALVTGLFGTERMAAKLVFSTTDISAKGPETYVFGPLDETTNAPHEGGLHRVKAHHDVTFTLRIRTRTGIILTDEEAALVNELLRDVAKNGIKLGYKSASGFGWFETSRSAEGELDLESGDPATKTTVPDTLYPSSTVTLPYRLTEPNAVIGAPPARSLAAWSSRELHSHPLELGLSGRITVQWGFETPFLIADETGSKPIKVGTQHVIPGATLRGTLRSALAHLTSARLSKLSSHAQQRLADEAGGGAFALRDMHTRSKGSNVTAPDFVEALLGYVHEGSDASPEAHRANHLASRVRVGFAYAAGALSETDPMHVTMRPPDIEGFSYEGGGRKRYPVDQASSNDVLNRLAAVGREARHANGTLKDDSKIVSYVKASVHKPASFVGHIDVHNITQAELWVLLHALTLGDTQRRHAMGQGRPFGAGRCFARVLRTTFTNSAGTNRDDLLAAAHKLTFPTKPQPDARLFAAKSVMSDAFKNARDTSTQDEFYASTDPVYGQNLVGRSRDSAKFGYQAKLVDFGDLRGSPTPESSAKAQATATARLDEVRKHNGGRIAALISKARE